MANIDTFVIEKSNISDDPNHKYTRKEMFIFIRTLLEQLEDTENNAALLNAIEQSVEMCNRYVGQLEKPVKPRVNEKAAMFAAQCLEIMEHMTNIAMDMEDELFTAKGIADLYNKEYPVDPDDIEAKPASTQKVSAAMRRLIAEGKVVKMEVNKKTMYKLNRGNESVPF